MENTNGEKPRELRGLYKNVKISVKALDTFIVVCVGIILLLVFLELRSPGFQITFDSQGGTDVTHQTQMHGELLTVPEPPTREGYRFTGWYTDTGCFHPWNTESDRIETDMTLYAGWEPLEPPQ